MAVGPWVEWRRDERMWKGRKTGGKQNEGWGKLTAA